MNRLCALVSATILFAGFAGGVEARVSLNKPVLHPGTSKSVSSPGIPLDGALRIADQAQSELSPSSVDWKIQAAHALLANELPEEARTARPVALDLMDRAAHLKIGKPMAARARQEIFALLRETGP